MADLVIILPSNIVYVAGYVNGEVKVFNQDVLNPVLWRANVDATTDSMYHVSLEMHDEAGNVGYFEKTVEYILPVFVFDRTQADIDRVKELRRIGWQNMTSTQRKEWISGLKGCLNTSDLKRIENDIYVIAQLLDVDVQTNKDNLPELPDSIYFARVLENVQILRNIGYLHGDTPEVPVQPLNTYQKWNDIERILHDIYWIYNANNSCYAYCGTELYAGSETELL